MPDKESVVFVEELLIVGQIVHEDRLKCSVVAIIRVESQPVHNAMGIGIDNKYRFSGSVEDYGIGGLLPDSINRK
jgi:hypothetical protein